MLASVLSLVTVCSLVLVVPVFAGVFGMERRRHLALTADRSRRVRLVLAAAVVGLATLGLSAALDAGAESASVVAVLMTGAVLIWGPLSGSWAVRGVVVWALLVTGAVGLLAWLVERIVVSSLSAAGLMVSAAAWVLLLVSLTRVQRYARDLISRQAGLVVRTSRHKRISLLRPAVSVVVIFAAGGVAVATTHGGPVRGRTAEAGAPGAPGSYAVPPAAPGLTRGVGAPSTVGIDLAAAMWRRGVPRSGAGARAATPVLAPTSGASTADVVPPLAGSAGASGPAPAAGPAAHGMPSHQAPVGGAVGGAAPRPSAGERPSVKRSSSTDGSATISRPDTVDDPATDTSSQVPTRTSPARKTTAVAEPAPSEARTTAGYDGKPGRPSTEPSPPDKPGSTSPPGPEAAPASQPSEAPSDAPSGSPSNVPSGSPSNVPSGSPSNVPSGSPSSRPASIPGSEPSDSPSSASASPRSGPPADAKPSEAPHAKPSDPPAQADKTRGYDKTKPNRVAVAPAPGPGRTGAS